MGKIFIDQYFYVESYESAKSISKAFQNFKFKFFDLGKMSTVYAKRFIKKTNETNCYPYKTIIRYTINFAGEFLEYGFLDERTKSKYPELVDKIKSQSGEELIKTICEYQALEDEMCNDVFYYTDFEEFLNSKLKVYLEKIFLASVISFSSSRTGNIFGICYFEKENYYQRAHIVSNSFIPVEANEYFSKDLEPIDVMLVWEWMKKLHKYKKDKYISNARPLTALGYSLNRNSFEQIFYSTIGLESVFSKTEKGVKWQLYNVIPLIFPEVSKEDIKIFYEKRSDFAHGNIDFTDYYENHNLSYTNLITSRLGQKSAALLIMTLRELVKKDAIKIHLCKNGKINYIKHDMQLNFKK